MAIAALTPNLTIANVLEFTESNGGLSATLDGSPIPINVTGTVDNWTVQMASLGESVIPSFVPFSLAEPESTNLKNTIVVFPNSANGIFEFTWTSDIPKDPQEGDLPASLTFLNGIQTLPSDITVIFTDKGDAPQGVPETGSTTVLLALAGVGLFGFNTLRGRRRFAAVSV